MALALFYASSAWESVLGTQKWKKKLDGSMLKVKLRVCSAYRTAPSAPSSPASRRTISSVLLEKAETKECIEKLWQIEWRNPTAGITFWTKRPIPNLRTLRNRKHEEVNFHLT